MIVKRGLKQKEPPLDSGVACRQVVLELLATAAGLEIAQIQPAHHLVDDLDLDSLSLFEIVSQINARFGTDFKVRDVRHLQTVGEVVQFAEQHIPPR